MENLARWIQNARWAPSGGNLQPWRLTATALESNLSLHFSIRPETKLKSSASDPWGAGALIGIGCYLENLIFSAPSVNLEFTNITNVTTPDNDFFSTSLDAEFTRSHYSSQGQNLIDIIQQRSTHRWPMPKDPLPQSLVSEMELLTKDSPVELLHLTAKRPQLIAIYRELAFVRMHNHFLFSELMQELFDPRTMPERETGLPYATLALPLTTTMALKLIQKFRLHPRQRWLNQQSLTDSIDMPLSHCSDVFYLKGPDDSPQTWLQVGRLYQRLALFAQQQRLATHPIAYGLIAYNHFKNPATSLLEVGERKTIEQLRQQAILELGVDFNNAGLLFRIGKPTRPGIASPRRPVEIQWMGTDSDFKTA